MTTGRKLLIEVKTSQPAPKRSNQFIKMEAGTSIVEFAVAAPLFFLVIFAAINLGIMLMMQNALESAAREAARYGITGQTQVGMTRAQAIKIKALEVLKDYSANIIKPDKVKFTTKAYSNLASVGRPEPLLNDSNKNKVWDLGDTFTDINGNGVWDADQGVSNSFGLPGQVVLYEISYTWDTIFPIFGASSLITLKGVTPIMNEDF